MGWRARALSRRATRALERQLDYQRAKVRRLANREDEILASMTRHSQAIRSKLEAFTPILEDARVLEVGSGTHGLIFTFGAREGIGVDPLAAEYVTLFPAWQHRARTIAARGEQLPFDDASFDIVLCDNVVDHAEDPARIVAEIARVLRPGGLLYFTVNVHHPFYHVAASVHAGWRALGVPLEITPFADHTVHLTPSAACRLFERLPLRLLSQSDTRVETKRQAAALKRRHAGDLLKRFFYKNALFETIAVREPRSDAEQ